MTVAAFFRDTRIQGILAADKTTPHPELLQEFFEQFGYDACAPAQLLALADFALRCGDEGVAREALERAVAAGQNTPQAYHKLGRLALSQKNPTEAGGFFEKAVAADPQFAFGYMGLARALHAQGLKDAALAAAERFMAFGTRPQAPRELSLLAEMADYFFDAQQRPRAQPLYEFVVRFGADRPRDAVRLADIYINKGEYEAAKTLMLEQEARGRLDHWGKRALAVAYSHLGDHARALALAEEALLAEPTSRPCLTGYLDVVAREADPAHMRDALARNAALLGPQGVLELQARLQLTDGDFAGAEAALSAVEFAYQSRLYHLCYEMGYAALGEGELDLALRVAERLGKLAPNDSFVKLLRVDAYFRQQMWDSAGAVLAGMTEAESARPQAILKRFEFACFTNDAALADTLSERLQAMDLPTRQYMLPVFRFFAERQRWDDLVDRALPWLAPDLNYRQIGYVLFRAAKYTERQAQMVAAVEALKGWPAHDGLVRLRANLLFDLADDLAAVQRLAADASIAEDAVLRRRLAVKATIFASLHVGRRAMVLCSDRNYLCGTFVALHSAMGAATHRGLDVFVVVDDDLADLATRAAAAFVGAGMAVRVLAASAIVPDPAKLSPRYGLFTSGHRLAAAAYYRIYAAQYLQTLGVYERAIYLDGDILLRGDLDQLFAADLAGHPLAARLEPMRAEVRRAIALHGLENNRYFNSGVLLFDLRHERLAAALDRAIAAVMDDDTKLLFHDQCALNLGFRADFADLDGAWNTAVIESDSLAEVPAAAALLHFLERPKPWSAAYGGDAGALWADQWRAAAAFMGEAVALEMFRLIQD